MESKILKEFVTKNVLYQNVIKLFFFFKEKEGTQKLFSGPRCKFRFFWIYLVVLANQNTTVFYIRVIHKILEGGFNVPSCPCIMKISKILFCKYADIFQTFCFLNVITQRGEWATFRITCCVHISAFLISIQRKCKNLQTQQKLWINRTCN